MRLEINVRVKPRREVSLRVSKRDECKRIETGHQQFGTRYIVTRIEKYFDRLEIVVIHQLSEPEGICCGIVNEVVWHCARTLLGRQNIPPVWFCPNPPLDDWNAAYDTGEAVDRRGSRPKGPKRLFEIAKLPSQPHSCQPFLTREATGKLEAACHLVILIDVRKQEGHFRLIFTRNLMMTNAILGGDAIIKIEKDVEYSLSRHVPSVMDEPQYDKRVN